MRFVLTLQLRCFDISPLSKDNATYMNRQKFFIILLKKADNYSLYMSNCMRCYILTILTYTHLSINELDSIIEEIKHLDNENLTGLDKID